MDSLFDLALEEMAYGKKSFPYAIKGRMIYEMALDEIKETNKEPDNRCEMSGFLLLYDSISLSKLLTMLLLMRPVCTSQ